MSKANGGKKRRKWSNMKRPNRIVWPCRLCGAAIANFGVCEACERATTRRRGAACEAA